MATSENTIRIITELQAACELLAKEAGHAAVALEDETIETDDLSLSVADMQALRGTVERALVSMSEQSAADVRQAVIDAADEIEGGEDDGGGEAE